MPQPADKRNRENARNRRFLAAHSARRNNARGGRCADCNTWGCVMTFADCLHTARRYARPLGYVTPETASLALEWTLKALEALAAERAAEREREPDWYEAMRAQTARLREIGNNPFRLWMDGRGYCVGRDAECPDACWRASGPCAPGTTTTQAATARVAMAREAAPEPVTVGHWGMHA
jgi:hypothetical protein